uniref:Uncharacterized protein K0098B12.37 n=1 Tax=Oryza sativa subsp. indica TaxID=39946 RepID=C8TF71_ORYSI|nr:hypothetical protein [Oryza sativa Indica Group]
MPHMAVTRVAVHGGVGPRAEKGAAHHVVHTWRRRGAHVAATWQPRGRRDWMAPIYRPIDRTADAARGRRARARLKPAQRQWRAAARFDAAAARTALAAAKRLGGGAGEREEGEEVCHRRRATKSDDGNGMMRTR